MGAECVLCERHVEAAGDAIKQRCGEQNQRRMEGEREGEMERVAREVN